ncbi:MAG TPA: PrsW family glutamic-type intramembrane protease [Pseudonocardia sp.]|nr:PrsW family glutamic-type intramembrane protease [Pseudonocardia sp.]
MRAGRVVTVGTLAVARPGLPWRLPALWMTAALVLGGLVLVAAGHPHAVASPAVLGVAVVLFALHGLLLWRVVHGLDLPVRRPAWLRATALAWGGLVAIGVAGYANSWVSAALVKSVPPELAVHLTPLRAPTVEESVKLLGVVTLVLLAGRRLSGPLDGLFYGALVGLGFQELENVHYALAAGHHHTALAALGSFLGRGVLTGWATHVAWTAVVGAGLGWAVQHRDRPWPARLGVVAAAFGCSWTLHALWNSRLGVAGLHHGTSELLRLAGLNLLGLAPAALVTWLALRGEARRCARGLAALADAAVAVDAEIAVLGSPVRRFRIRWEAYVLGGRASARAVRRLHRAQTAVGLSVADAPGSAELAGLRAAVVAVRGQLAAARLGPLEERRGGTVGGEVALAVGLVAPVGLWVASALGLVALKVPATSVTAGGLAVVGVAALLLAGRAVCAARRAGAVADVRYGIAGLLGVVTLVLAAVFGGQLLMLVFA